MISDFGALNLTIKPINSEIYRLFNGSGLINFTDQRAENIIHCIGVGRGGPGGGGGGGGGQAPPNNLRGGPTYPLPPPQ